MGLLETQLITLTEAELKQTNPRFLYEVELLNEINNLLLARSSWKFNYLNPSLYKNIFINKFKNIKPSRLFCRSSSIPKFFLKKTIMLYKGNIFIKIFFTKYHINYKSGEFGVTKKPFNFPLKNKKAKR